MEITFYCHACGQENITQDKVYRQETCPQCGRYLHCCKNCKFYDERAYQQCKEPMVDFVNDKEMANFCGYFKPSEEKHDDTAQKRAEAARKKLEELFKKQDP